MYLSQLYQNNLYNYPRTRQLYQQNKRPSFGKVEPEMLFINIPGFDKDFNWANAMIKTIDKTVKIITSGKSSLTNLLDGIKKDYGKYFTEKIAPKTQKVESVNYGVDRKGELLTFLVGRYNSYFDRASEMVLKDYAIFDEEQICNTRLADFDKSVQLTKTFYNLENFEIHWQHTDAQNIQKVIDYSSKIYQNLNSLRNELLKKNDKNLLLNKINKKIAELHWYLANAIPYERGSAGIVDVLTKSIYESMYIQTSPWKKGLSPDMEAFVTPVNEFIEKYPSYFDSPPKFIK